MGCVFCVDSIVLLVVIARYLFVCCRFRVTGIIKWILGDRSATWMSFLTRHTLEDATSYKQARQWLSDTKMLAPAYFILGGNSSNEVSSKRNSVLFEQDSRTARKKIKALVYYLFVTYRCYVAEQSISNCTLNKFSNQIHVFYCFT